MKTKEAIKEIEDKIEQSLYYLNDTENKESKKYYLGRVDAFTYSVSVLKDIEDE